MPEVMDFGDITPIEVKVRIQGKNYVLREASEAVTCRYRNAQVRCAHVAPDGKATKVEGPIADTEPLLVSLCLFEEDTGAPVDQKVIMQWPSRVVRQLFDKVKEISDLDESAQSASVKNVPAGTEAN